MKSMVRRLFDSATSFAAQQYNRGMRATEYGEGRATGLAARFYNHVNEVEHSGGPGGCYACSARAAQIAREAFKRRQVGGPDHWETRNG